MSTHITTSDDDQYRLTPNCKQLFYYNELQQEDDAIKERFNNLQTQLQELDILHQQPSIDLHRIATPPSSRDSGIPIPSSSSSSCCSSPFEKTAIPTTSFDSQSFEFFLHPRHESTKSMSHIYDTTSRYRSHGRNVHWNDDTVLASRGEENNDYHSDLTNVTKRGQRISLNTSLPFHSKLNIRIHTNRRYRDGSNENDQVKTTATIQRLDPQYEHEHIQASRRAYLQHYSTLTPNENIIINARTDSPIHLDKLPTHRQISLPVSLPIDQRLFLYIRNGEVLARC